MGKTKTIELTASELAEMVATGAIKCINQNVNEGAFKNALLGLGMLGAVSGGMQSCSGPINPPSSTGTQTTDVYRPDYSDREWAFHNYVGKKVNATKLLAEDKKKIRILYLDERDTTFHVEGECGWEFRGWSNCSWGIFYENTEQRDNYFVDTYHSKGYHMDDTEYDGSAYFEVWYDGDTTKTMNERVMYIRIYRSPETKRETLWTVDLSNIKGTKDLEMEYEPVKEN